MPTLLKNSLRLLLTTPELQQIVSTRIKQWESESDRFAARRDRQALQQKFDEILDKYQTDEEKVIKCYIFLYKSAASAASPLYKACMGIFLINLLIVNCSLLIAHCYKCRTAKLKAFKTFLGKSQQPICQDCIGCVNIN